MKVLGFLVIFIAVFWGMPAHAFPQDLTYVVNEKPTLPVKRILGSIHSVFQSSELLLFRSNRTDRISPDWLDQVYGDESFSSFAFVKLGVRPTSEKFFGSPIAHPEGELVHFEINKGSHVAIFFHNVSSERVASFTSKLKTAFAQASGRNSVWFDTLVPRARAQECDETQVGKSVADLKDIPKAAEGAEQASSIGSCMADMWEGLRNSVVGQATSILNFTSELKFSPREAWSAIANSGKNLYKFASSLKTEIMNGLPGLRNAAGLLTADLICAFIGELGPDLLLVIAGGYAAAKITIAIGKYIQRLGMIEKFLTYAAKMKSLTGKTEIPAGFFKRLIRGDIAAEVLETIEMAASRGLHALANGAAQCTN